MALVELEELAERVVADDIGVQYKEGRVVFGKNLLGELEWASSIEGLGLDGKGYVDIVLLLILNRSVLAPSSCQMYGHKQHALTSSRNFSMISGL